MGGRVKLGIELGISCSDTMLNYRMSQKLKLLGNGEFNYLTTSLTYTSCILCQEEEEDFDHLFPHCPHEKAIWMILILIYEQKNYCQIHINQY